MTHEPQKYYKLPLELWSFQELTEALGTKGAAEALGVRPGNIRVMRHRGGTSVERMQTLQAAFRANESANRSRMVTLRAGQAARQPTPTKESAHV